MIECGLSPGRVWALSWPEFSALGDAVAARNARDDYRAGVIACEIRNLFAKSEAVLITPADLFDSVSLAVHGRTIGEMRKDRRRAEVMREQQLLSVRKGK